MVFPSLPQLQAGFNPTDRWVPCRQQTPPRNSSAWSASVDKPRWSCVSHEASKSMAFFLSPRNSSARTASVDNARGQSRPLVELASVKGLYYIFCSLIGDFGHPVGRQGEGRGWGNTASAKRQVTVYPSGVWTLFLGADPIPLRRRV